MKHTIKFLCVGFLLVLTLSFLRASTVHAALIVSDGMAASLVLGQPNFTSNTVTTTQTGMNFPYGAAVDPTTGKVFIADFSNHRVLRFASVTSLTNGAAAEAVLGQPNFTSNTPATTQSGMVAPRAVFVDAAGRLWVGEVANNRVLRFDNASSLGNGANADGVLGQTLFTTNASATTQNGMWLPEGIFVDSTGRLWVADSNNYRVLRFDNAAAKSNGANADGVLGQTLFTTRVATTSQSGMYAPYGVHLDSAGRLWVADHVNNRLLRFDNAAASPNGDNADGVLGQPNFTSNASATTQSGMSNPTGVTGNDNTGQIFLTDRNNNRVLVFNNAAAKVNGDNADNVIGQANFTSNGAGLSATTLNNPYRIYFDPGAEVLWVGDSANNRVLMYGAGCPSALTVMNNNDSGAGSLRQAMADVCPGGTITFDNSLSGQTISLASTLPINQNLTIDGSSLSTPVMVSGGNAVRVFHVTGGTVNLESLTVANGLITGGVCAGCGAGLLIENGATVTINNSTFSGHTAEHGGAIENWNGSLTVTHSTFANNTTTVGGGAAINIINPSTALIANSTFSLNNGAGGWGGAIYNQGTVTLVNNTFSGNGAASGGGIYNNGGTMHNTNNIFANATLGGDCAGTAPATNVNNLVEDGSCSPTLTGDPLLDPTGLQDNGGSTQTFALQAGSTAINAGDNTACAAAPINNLDQRGVPRPQGAQCDIGSYEVVSAVVPGSAGGLGPGGVGHTDGSTSLELWLRADREIFSNVGCTTPGTDGNTVACWQDQSGNNFDFTNSLANLPTYELTETGINSQPSLQFANDRLVYTNFPALTSVNDYAIYGVSLHGADGQTLIGGVQTSSNGHGVQIASWNGNDVRFLHRMPFGASGGNDLVMTNSAYTANAPHIVTAIRNRSSNIQSARVDGGTLQSIATSAAVYSSNLDIAVGNRSGGANSGHPLIGYIGEVIIFSEAPADVRRLLVENYLSSKFNITIPPASDFYDGDTAGNGNFDLDVAGIGQFGGNQHTQAHAAGMIVVDNNFLNDNGDWLLLGHRTPANSNSTADLPTGGVWDGINDIRWARHWYVDVTDGVGVDCTTPGTCFVDIVFDFSEAGMNGGLPPNGLASNYRLLKRTLDTGPFSDIGTATVIVGDQVQFLNVDVSLLGSNFTLGSLDGAASPTAITMHHAARSISQPGYSLLIAVLLVLLMAVTTVVWRRRA